MLQQNAHAKVNLFLEVTGRRPDGFHNLESVFVTIDLADTLAVEPCPEPGVFLSCDAAGMPPTDDNLVVRAARLLARRAGVTAGARFRLEKRIPPGAGLGGSSSDAAAALVLANRLWGLGYSRRALADIGATLGSDIPFFLYGGACLCRGKGEVIEPLAPCPAPLELGLLLSNLHSDTGAAYRGLRLAAEPRSAAAFRRAWERGDTASLRRHAFNRFEDSVFAAFPALGEVWRYLTANGVTLRLTGSGSGMWFFGGAEAVSALLVRDAKIAALTERLALRALPVRLLNES